MPFPPHTEGDDVSGAPPLMSTVLGSIEETIEAALRSWCITVTAERNRLIAQGMSEAAVESMLLAGADSLTGLFAGARVRIGQAVAQAANAAQHNAYLNTLARELGGDVTVTQWQWFKDPSADSCDDCIARDGQVRSYTEWEEIGLPGAGGTQCGGNCRCTIAPEDKTSVPDGKE